jgi:acid phosphatase
MRYIIIALCLLCASTGFAGSFGHVYVLIEENREYATVVGDTVNAPWFNSMIKRYGLATNAWADTHPSIGNYFMLTTGQVFTNNDSYTGTFTADNIVRQCVASGITWRSYAEGYASGVSYADRHNVFVFFSDVKNSAALQKNIVETDSLAYDIAHHRLPQIGFIAPNLIDDGHDGTLAQADAWANAHIGPLIASPEFQADGVLIITWDEGVNDNKYGGGQICTIVVSPAARAGYRSTRFYQHESTLRFIMQAVGMSSFPGAAASAPDMSEFFPAASIAPGTPPHGGSFSLYQNYPNPFNPSTVIRYHVPRAAHVKLTLFDPLGREIGILLDAAEQEGDHEIRFDGAGHASGLYYCRMQSGNFSQTRSVTLLK